MAQGAGGNWIHQMIEAGTAVLGLGAAAAAYFQGRKHERASFISAVQDAAHLVITDLTAHCDRLQTAIADSARQLEESRQQHEQCRIELVEMKAQIAQLMAAQPVALYQVKPPA